MTPATLDTAAGLRQLSTEELAQLGEESLRQRLMDQAAEAREKHGPLSAANLEAFLADCDCLRYPTRLVFEFGEMAMHQFAQPDFDHRNTAEGGRVLYLRPMLRDRPDLTLLALGYMVPLINYGEMINDEHCLLYGATLLGLDPEEFYRQVCALADFVGAERRPGSAAVVSGPPP